MTEFIRYHIKQAIRAAIAESNGFKEEAEMLRAQGNLRLMIMSDDELEDLARALSHPPARSIARVLDELFANIDIRRQTAGEWLDKLTMKPADLFPSEG